MKTVTAVQSVRFPSKDKRERNSMGAAGQQDSNAQFPLSKGDWERAKTILAVAADVPLQERTRYVETHLPNDPTLSTTVLTLLQTYDKTIRALRPQHSVEQHEDRIQSGGQYGKYRVLESLGRGGMGQVFLAEDTQVGRRVAIKTLFGAWLDSPTARRQLLTEARAVAQLEHQNIVRLYEFFEDQGRFMMVMEYVEGRTGAALIAEGPIPLGLALRIGIQICDAVVYAHDHGILHCDLKPANVQVTSDGTAKVLDFGLAQAKHGWYKSDEDTTENGPLFGTPAYMAPERLSANAPKETCDIYSLGVTLFELVTGRRPFDEPHPAALAGAILGTSAPKASSITPDCPARLDEIIERAMAKDPNQRYQTARELSRDLHEVLKVLEADSQTVPYVAPTRTAYSRLAWVAILLLGSIAGLTVIGFLTSTFYNSPLEITMDFEGESPFLWPVWGLRSLVSFFFLSGVVVLALGLAIQLCRLPFQALPPLRRWSERTLAGAGKFVNRVHSFRTASIAAGLLLIQAVAFQLAWWRFSEVIESLNSFVLQSGSLMALGPGYSLEHRLYRQVFSLLLLGFGWSWYLLLKSQWQAREPVGRVTLGAGSFIIILTLFMLVTPYRLFVHSEGEQVLYQSETCYLVGQKGDEARLFCPQQRPWNRLVDLKNHGSDLKRIGKTESIFSTLSESKTKSQRIP